jgi:AcrR family transcriptional regulator
MAGKTRKFTQRMSAEERRALILQNAEPLFARLGFRRTTTASIASAAGVTEPILYRHFQGKLDLFHTLLQKISLKAMQEWETMLKGVENPMEKLVLIAQSFPVIGRKFEDDFRVMLAALTELDDPVTKKILRRHYETYAGFIADILGDLPPFKASGLDPGNTAWHLVHLAVGYALMDPVDIPQTKKPEYVQHAVRFLGQIFGT